MLLDISEVDLERRECVGPNRIWLSSRDFHFNFGVFVSHLIW